MMRLIYNSTYINYLLIFRLNVLLLLLQIFILFYFMFFFSFHFLVLILYRFLSFNAKFLLARKNPGPEVVKRFSCSTQVSMKFFLLINVKMHIYEQEN